MSQIVGRASSELKGGGGSISHEEQRMAEVSASIGIPEGKYLTACGPVEDIDCLHAFTQGGIVLVFKRKNLRDNESQQQFPQLKIVNISSFMMPLCKKRTYFFRRVASLDYMSKQSSSIRAYIDPSFVDSPFYRKISAKLKSERIPVEEQKIVAIDLITGQPVTQEAFDSKARYVPNCLALRRAYDDIYERRAEVPQKAFDLEKGIPAGYIKRPALTM